MREVNVSSSQKSLLVLSDFKVPNRTQHFGSMAPGDKIAQPDLSSNLEKERESNLLWSTYRPGLETGGWHRHLTCNAPANTRHRAYFLRVIDKEQMLGQIKYFVSHTN